MESPIIQKISQNSIKAGLYTNVVQVSLTPSGLTFTTFLTLRHLCPAKLFLPPPQKKICNTFHTSFITFLTYIFVKNNLPSVLL